jgi:hypothetical protein
MSATTSAAASVTPALVTFAFVRDRWEQTGDIINGLVPLFAPVIKERANEKFIPEVFAADLDKIFGLRMTSLAVQDLAPRLCAAGLLVPVEATTGVERYYNTDPHLPNNPNIDQRVSETLDHLIARIELSLERYHMGVSRDEIERQILNSILTLNFSKDSYTELPPAKENQAGDADTLKPISSLGVIIARD